MDVARANLLLLLMLSLGCGTPDTLDPALFHYIPLDKPFSVISQEEAIREIERVSEAIDGSSSDDQVSLYVERGLWCRAAGKTEKSIADFSVAIELAPDDWKPLFHRWLLYQSNGDSERAAADRRAGLQLNADVFSQTYSEDSGVI